MLYSEEEKKAIVDLEEFVSPGTEIKAISMENIKIIYNLIKKQNLKINKIKNQLENQIDFCKKENAHHYDICSINLRFNEGLLKILEE